MIENIIENKDDFVKDTSGEIIYTNARKLSTLDYLAKKIYENNIPGDIVETGVYRGTSVLYMTKIFPDRTIWAMDSYCGIQGYSDVKYKEFEQNTAAGQYAASLETVQDNFIRYGELTDRVKFVKGYFTDTLDTVPIEKIALLRFDADTYSATLEVLNALYDRVAKGGFVVIDDFAVLGCYTALVKYVKEKEMNVIMYSPDTAEREEPIINWMNIEKKSYRRRYSGAWWRK